MDKAINTIKNMMKKRGYNNFKEIESEPLKKFIASSDLHTLCVTIVISYASKDPAIKQYIKHVLDQEISLILVCNYEIPSILKRLEILSNFAIQIFSVKELQFDIINHSMQPYFEKIDNTQSENHVDVKILNKLPSMLRTDPVARYLGCIPGDIIKIIPKDTNDKFGITLRLVK
jgi:DNA-directed RNA polymerase subunit H (RpoH/RPB5)